MVQVFWVLAVLQLVDQNRQSEVVRLQLETLHFGQVGIALRIAAGLERAVDEGVESEGAGEDSLGQHGFEPGLVVSPAAFDEDVVGHLVRRRASGLQVTHQILDLWAVGGEAFCDQQVQVAVEDSDVQLSLLFVAIQVLSRLLLLPG